MHDLMLRLPRRDSSIGQNLKISFSLLLCLKVIGSDLLSFAKLK